MDSAHFDAVIVGSGFGGSVMAYRLAEAGLRVCVLERGKAYPSGSFPRDPAGMLGNVWNPDRGLRGLFEILSFKGISSIVASGLGGGSLIYSNVMLRKDERWFVKEDKRNGGHEYWPVTRADLDPHYDRVERMLNVQSYPFEHAPFSTTVRTQAMKAAAGRLGLEWFLPKLAVTFGNDGDVPVPAELLREAHPSLHGDTRYTCRLCGECNLGCNYGSKNSLDYTYLSAAQRLGAELRTQCEVRSFEPRHGGGYTIQYVQHDPERAGAPSATAGLPAAAVTANRMILCAGALGSTYLLLRNRSAFPRISRQLGAGFSANGDIVALAAMRGSAGVAAASGLSGGSHGPIITSAIRVADRVDGGTGPGFYVEDGSAPEFVTAMMGFVSLVLALWGQAAEGAPHRLAADASASTMLLLGMGRDVPDGRMRLRGDKLDLAWSSEASSACFTRIRRTMKEITGAMGAEFVEPSEFAKHMITLHPLGGCPMGCDATEGVVNSYGEVFNYPGLYIADGSVMPGPVGPNPSLTIAALADRCADHIVERRR